MLAAHGGQALPNDLLEISTAWRAWAGDAGPVHKRPFIAVVGSSHIGALRRDAKVFSRARANAPVLLQSGQGDSRTC